MTICMARGPSLHWAMITWHGHHHQARQRFAARKPNPSSPSHRYCHHHDGHDHDLTMTITKTITITMIITCFVCIHKSLGSLSEFKQMSMASFTASCFKERPSFGPQDLSTSKMGPFWRGAASKKPSTLSFTASPCKLCWTEWVRCGNENDKEWWERVYVIGEGGYSA